MFIICLVFISNEIKNMTLYNQIWEFSFPVEENKKWFVRAMIISGFCKIEKFIVVVEKFLTEVQHNSI